MTVIPRPEYPRPQFIRNKWLNLNGQWEHSTDRGNSGMDRFMYEPDNTEFHETITVPFCRESTLSGLGDLDFCEHCWYRKKLTLPEDWDRLSERIILHIGACDWKTIIWVNGNKVTEHIGGYVSFSADLTDFLIDGENTITLKVDDDIRSGLQPSGKQHPKYPSQGMMYRRTTGIWQTVWLEAVPTTYIEYTRYFTDIDRNVLTVEAHIKGEDGTVVSAVALYDNREVGSGEGIAYSGRVTFEVPLSELHLWEVGEGDTYDLILRAAKDEVKSYFGMRLIEGRDGFLYINRRPVFMRLVLDQGFYPDGIYTAQNTEELFGDVDRAMAMGFNGARLHQKVFEPAFLSYCDKKGYIVWGEHANWGMNCMDSTVYGAFLPEWTEILRRDFNHPAIIGWCPINESEFEQNKTFMQTLSAVTKGYDTTRLYIDASGWTHNETFCTDIYDHHDYEQNPEKFAEHLAPLKNGEPIDVHWLFEGNPFMVNATFASEYGGTRWAEDCKVPGGYGISPKTEEEFLARFKGLTDVLLDHPRLTGFCYTQLTDVEEELNGLYYFNRIPKFPPETIRAIVSRKAKIEE